jgi:hypothetical protein
MSPESLCTEQGTSLFNHAGLYLLIFFYNKPEINSYASHIGEEKKHDMEAKKYLILRPMAPWILISVEMSSRALG